MTASVLYYSRGLFFGDHRKQAISAVVAVDVPSDKRSFAFGCINPCVAFSVGS